MFILIFFIRISFRFTQKTTSMLVQNWWHHVTTCTIWWNSTNNLNSCWTGEKYSSIKINLTFSLMFFERNKLKNQCTMWRIQNPLSTDLFDLPFLFLFQYAVNDWTVSDAHHHGTKGNWKRKTCQEPLLWIFRILWKCVRTHLIAFAQFFYDFYDFLFGFEKI